MHITTIRPLVLAVLAALAVSAGTVASAAAAEPPQPGAEAQTGDLADLSLEQLNNVVITSVSRQEERLANAAASVFIISAADIRRSGARSLPEALRLAPNLQVARQTARDYAITARGFNGQFANKLLVMIDGRSVYSPLFSGVFWETQDVVMEDIERIEVISGPGATIWGANAVNGVINIITRSAKDTQGGLATVSAGNRERDATVRYGGVLGNGGHYRLYGRYTDVDDSERANGTPDASGLRRRQAGFRADWDRPLGGLTLSGDAYAIDLAQPGRPDAPLSGANLIARVTRKLTDDSDLRLQLVLDHVERNQPFAFIERLDVVDLDAQHSMRVAGRHNIAWGAGYRYARDRLTPSLVYGFLPAERSMHWGSLFAQDEWALRDDLRLTVGAKVEHNNYTGAEYLPNLRLAWSASPTQLVWGSLSRTVRAPSRIDRDYHTPAVPILIGKVPRFTVGGGPDFQSETANVAELGYRIQPSLEWSYAATAFYADYDRLRTQEPNVNGPAYSGLLEVRNMAAGQTRGIEMWARWQPVQSWRLNAGLVVQQVRTHLKEGSRDSSGSAGVATSDPNHYWQLRSSHDLPYDMQLDWTLRYMGALEKPAVPSYYELDAHWLWKPRPNVDVALIGQNLLHRSHAEFGAAPNRSVVQRSVVLKLTLRF
ncbi:TonB-dependent siderophore receptor [Massilia sp. YMA4]|uniref:TonB-dependent receptor plug domain-containing protein n=1 Tax=Massilia sp. YMA4 TaxID=1593482 RepID=UPI000DD12512|nr:TonB-dependent receptor [Massilia sp. YMA4]AXA91537.1 TonB-dependent receptor [Massilia sp. YMA4]